MNNPLGAAAGLLVDRVLGEPPAPVHPVAAFGALMQQVERAVYRDTRGAGVVYAGVGTLVGGASSRLARRTSAAVSVAVAGRQLRTTAAEVRDALVGGDVDAARALVPALVGRDPTDLDASGLSAAVIESLAENTVDAVVAPALYGAVAGARGALAYRAVNTMDAMVGHHSERYEQFGWAAARLDDVANYIPARCTAALVVGVRPRAAVAIARAIHRQAPRHPSPNAGVAEAAFAAALGCELGGSLRYGERLEARPRLGWGPRPVAADIDRAIALAAHVELALVGVLAGFGLVRWRRRR